MDKTSFKTYEGLEMMRKKAKLRSYWIKTNIMHPEIRQFPAPVLASRHPSATPIAQTLEKPPTPSLEARPKPTHPGGNAPCCRLDKPLPWPRTAAMIGAVRLEIAKQ